MAVPYHTHVFEIPVASDAEVEAGVISDKVVVPSNLGTAAVENVEAFATAAQGTLADSSLQPGDVGVSVGDMLETTYDPQNKGGDAFPYDTRADAAGATIQAAVHSVSLRGDAAVGDGLGGLYIDSNNGSTDTFVSGDGRTWYRAADVGTARYVDGSLTDAKVAQTSALGRRILDVAYLTDPQFGALYGVDSPAAASANATALSAFLHHCANNNVKGVIPVGDLYLAPVDVTAISGDLEIECNARIINQAGAAATQRLLMVDGIGTGSIKWRGGRFDQNGGAFSCLEVRDWAVADGYIDEAYGITCTPSSSSSTSCLVFANIRKGQAGWGWFHDCDKGTNTQGSLPRAVSVSVNDGLRSDVDITGGRVTDHHGMFVFGEMAGGVINIFGGYGSGLADNGIYNVGDASEVNAYNLTIDDVEEPVVNNGTGVVRFVSGRMTNFGNSIGIQNTGDLEIENSYIASRRPADGGGANILKTRPATVNAGSVRLRNNVIDAWLVFGLLNFGSGTLVSFEDVNNTWRYHYDSSITTTDSLMSWPVGGIEKFVSRGSIYEIYDDSGDIDSAVRFLSMPNVTKESEFNSKLVNRTGDDATGWRVSNARQQLFTFSGLFSVNNIGSEREVNQSATATAPPREVWGTAAPTSGYWARGSRVWNTSPSASGTLGWVCVTAGTPGTWKTFGSISA